MPAWFTNLATKQLTAYRRLIGSIVSQLSFEVDRLLMTHPIAEILLWRPFVAQTFNYMINGNVYSPKHTTWHMMMYISIFDSLRLILLIITIIIYFEWTLTGVKASPKQTDHTFDWTIHLMLWQQIWLASINQLRPIKVALACPESVRMVLARANKKQKWILPIQESTIT